MIEYKCFRCGYEASQKIGLVRHLKRKNMCKAILDDISIESMVNYYGFEIPKNSTKIHQNPPKIHHDTKKNVEKISTKIHQKLEKSPPKSTKIHQNPPKNEIINECAYCYKVFSRSDSLKRHLGRCKIKKNNDKKDNEIKELKETVKQLLKKESTGNIINNNDNKHIDNSTHINVISLNNYGSENTQYITKEYLMGLLEKPFQSIPELIKYTHFNKDYPENQNIKLTNKKEPFVKVLKNNKWELADRKDTINDLIDQKHSILNTVDIKNNFDTSIQQRIESFNAKYLNDDKETLNKLYKDSELVLLNNS